MQLAGYLGKSANAIKNKIIEIRTGVAPARKKSGKNTKIGKRPDLGLFFRSAWEANVFRYLKFTHSADTPIEYEPQTFSFIEFGVKHGAVSYTPDIKFTDLYNGAYVFYEIKGFLDAKDKSRMNKFKKYYPEEFCKLIVVCGGKSKTAEYFTKLGVKSIIDYNQLKKQWKDKIPNWE